MELDELDRQGAVIESQKRVLRALMQERMVAQGDLAPGQMTMEPHGGDAPPSEQPSPRSRPRALAILRKKHVPAHVLDVLEEAPAHVSARDLIRLLMNFSSKATEWHPREVQIVFEAVRHDVTSANIRTTMLRMLSVHELERDGDGPYRPGSAIDR